MGVILAALVVGAALMMRVPTSFTLFGYPGIAMIFFLLAAAGGLASPLQWRSLLTIDQSMARLSKCL